MIGSGREFSELVSFGSSSSSISDQHVHGTTVLALRFDKGVFIIADRRATMGNLIMYEDANKIESLDESTVVAISGAYARAIEVIRYLKHAFKYYERLNQFPLSTEGKLMEISRSLSGNLDPSNTGVFLPIAAAYDRKTDDFNVYFFDIAGARFLGSDYAAAGSGSERIRGVFEYLAQEKGEFRDRPREDVLRDGLKLLDLASQMDSATGGIVPRPPKVVVLTREGVEVLTSAHLKPIVDEVVKIIEHRDSNAPDRDVTEEISAKPKAKKGLPQDARTKKAPKSKKT